MRTSVTAVLVGFSLAVGGCGSSDDEEPNSTSSAAQEDLQERLDKLESEAEEREAEAAERVEAAEKKAREAKKKAKAARRKARAEKEQDSAAVAPTTEPTADGGSGGITVPDVTGLDHQAAQDALQGEGLWILDEEDCTGQGRLLLFDRNWEVVSTDPPAGAQVSEDTTITLCSKKQGE